ncbi:peptidoglycan-binding protein [Jiella sonneratiae]|uniref:SEL1-like repeat protein n=1 Tax=Jiella sonneratiae TaxID=2816856 RepID=A0ABS3J3F8_9HYPH|nr:peptidoglycan-binding protein [Jiella sonneratiae]MBO0904204.1 SEL1-like repeat protein [Jiella sonneratiae]
MADLQGMEKGRHRGAEEGSSLESLSRTLEELEARLSKLTASHARAAADLHRHEPAAARPDAAEPVLLAASAGRRAVGAARPSPRTDLSQAVSEIVMRQRTLNRSAAARPAAAGAALREAPVDDISAKERSEAQPRVTPLPATDEAAAARLAARPKVPAGPSITEQLERLREELRADMAKSFQPRFDDMRDAVDELRRMIAERASSAKIDAEIARVHEGLARMATSGADEVGVEGLRSELDSIKSLVKDVAREESLRLADAKWDDIRETINDREAASTTERRDIKDELERLRMSLGGLASEEHIKAVERRWDEFESRYLDKPERAEGPDLTELLRSEMASLRDKLETLASEQSVKAVEARWGSLEERFASRAIEENIGALSGRMEQLEKTLSRLPDSLALAPIEARLEALSAGLDALGAARRDEAEEANFQALEERLDEISRAIVAAATKAPSVDMSPVERVEARLQALQTRVDSLGEADVEAMSTRIAELADRIEGLSNGPAIAALGERIEAFSSQLDSLASMPANAGPDVAAIEARLVSLNQRLESFAAPSLDPEIVGALEAQITRLSERIAEVGSATALSDPDLDERLATIEFRIEENREAIIESAQAAADAAVRRMMEEGEGRQGAYVEQLAGDLRALQEMSRASGEQSQTFYEAMHATLLKLVDRIDRIDAEIGSGREPAAAEAVHAAPAVDEAPRGLRGMLKRRSAKAAPAAAREMRPDPWQEPEFADHAAASAQPEGFGGQPDGGDAGDPLDVASQEANRPLAVGSGQPDIVSLIERVRAQQAGRSEEDHGGKADFIAAARRAALAAAAEADVMRNSRAGEADNASGEGLAATIRRRRKPILLAVSAILLAVLASQMAPRLMSGSAPENRAARDAVATQDQALPAGGEANVSDTTTAAEPVSKKQATAAGDAAGPGIAVPAGSASNRTADVPAPMTTAGALPSPKVGFSLDDGPSQAGFAETAGPAADASAIDAPNAQTASQGAVAGLAEPAPADAGAATDAQGAQPAIAPADLPSIPEGLASQPLMAAAQAGDPKALFEIGLRLMEGRLGEPDPKAAARWFELAAGRDFAPAEYSLGTLYEKGNGVDRDLAKARDEYQAAADGGNVRAMHNLAVLYATGIDGKSDPAKAAQWFEKAASYGMPDSQYNLGILFARGAGVDQDLVKSYKWFSIVAGEGDKDAASKRDEIRKALTPAQLKSADADIAGFKPLARNEQANTVDIPKEWTGPSEKTETSSVDMTRAIRNIQAILIKIGYDPGAPDGVMGEKTTQAIKAFQKDSGLAATGKVDETLIRKLLARKDG